MNLPYLLKILETDKISELVENIDLPPLDINLAIDDNIAAGWVEADRDTGFIKSLKDPEISFDSDLANKLLRTMQHYEKKDMNITRGRLNSLVKDPASGAGYPWHEYLMALQYLIDSDQILEEVVEVPEEEGSRKKHKRPYHKFVFLQFPDNPNDDWNKKVINNWIATWNKKKQTETGYKKPLSSVTNLRLKNGGFLCSYDIIEA